MADFHVRSDSVDVEQIMRQIRARIREKRGADYTEAELQQLATVKLEKFLDPRGVRSDLVEQFRRRRSAAPDSATYEFDDTSLYETHRGALRTIRRWLNPVLKLFLNPNPLIHALKMQKRINEEFRQREELFYELLHNLVVETTRLGIEAQNLKMRVESLSGRLDFDERRARSLEGVVQYRPGALPRSGRGPGGPPPQPSPAAPPAPVAAASAPVSAGPAGAPSAAALPGPPGAAVGSGTGTGDRRRRRRLRRRRPGRTMADTQGPAAFAGGSIGAAGAAPYDAAGSADGYDGPNEPGDSEGPDDSDGADGAPEQ